MVIVIEGIDNSGKSTLARLVARYCGMALIESEGPPRYPGEIDERVKRYALHRNTVFVRHPCVSQVIYGKMRSEQGSIDPELVQAFYKDWPLLIYCDPLDRGLGEHVIKPEVDKPEHLEKLERNYDLLLAEYRSWAVRHATLCYRIGDSMERIAALCSTIAWRHSQPTS